VWAPEEYEKLPAYDLDTPYQPPAVFLCHQQDGRLCAGWCGTHNMADNLGVRLAASMELLDLADVLDYVTDVSLFASGTEAAHYGMRDVMAPRDDARRVAARLERKQGRAA
jgi:hypothetical protein